MASRLPSFDRLMDLAQNNPEELESLRQSLSDEIIQSASPQFRARLEGLNFQINMERQRCKTPLQSCIRMADMMHDSFDQMRERLHNLLNTDIRHLKAVETGTPAANCPQPDQGKVVVFRPRR